MLLHHRGRVRLRLLRLQWVHLGCTDRGTTLRIMRVHLQR